jgi:hypothetical protein
LLVSLLLPSILLHLLMVITLTILPLLESPPLGLPHPLTQ